MIGLTDDIDETNNRNYLTRERKQLIKQKHVIAKRTFKQLLFHFFPFLYTY